MTGKRTTDSTTVTICSDGQAVDAKKWLIWAFLINHAAALRRKSTPE
jgi:hypothetical protein